MRLKAQTDGNHSEIVTYLRRLGYEVKSTAPMGRGFPDLLVSNRIEMWLIEVKDGPDADFTPDQKDFLHAWKGKPVLVFRDLKDVWRFHKGENVNVEPRSL